MNESAQIVPNGKVLLMVAAGLLVSLLIAFLLLDQPVTNFFDRFSLGSSIPVRLITELGLGLTQILLFLTLVALYEEYRTAVVGILALTTAGLSAAALKHVFGLPGPHTLHPSFPSGHTATAFAAAVALAYRYPRQRHLFYLAAVAVAVSRLALQKHFPSDVCAGAAMGITAGVAAEYFCGKFSLAGWQNGSVRRLEKGVIDDGDSPESTTQNAGSVITGTVPEAAVGWTHRALRKAAIVLLPILLVYAFLGSDVPQYHMRITAPVVLFLLLRKAARTIMKKSHEELVPR